jgi:hypothetical protein
LKRGVCCSRRGNVNRNFRANRYLATGPPTFKGKGAKVRGESLAKIGLWKLAGMQGDFDETCEIRSCDQVASSVLVIFYPYGSASIKFYCSEHEGDGVADLKRNNAGAKLIDHRARAREAQRQHRR